MRRCLPLLLLLLAILTSCDSRGVFSDNRFLMGTQCSLTLYKESDTELFDGFFDLLEQIDHTISRTYEHSEIHAINQAAGVEKVAVSEETFNLIKRSLEIAELTDGAFNPLIGGITALWGIGTDDAMVPAREEISFLLPYCSLDHIVLDESEYSVFLTSPYTQLDLGGIGKGYASNVLSSFLEESGVESAIINLGGNIYCVGEKEKGDPFVIGLQNPQAAHGGYYDTVQVRSSAVVTSGGYERYTEEEGVVYHHIFDPQTGYPSTSDLASVTIISEDGTLADALSTAVFVLGSKEGSELLEALGTSAVLLTRDGETIRL